MPVSVDEMFGTDHGGISVEDMYAEPEQTGVNRSKPDSGLESTPVNSSPKRLSAKSDPNKGYSYKIFGGAYPQPGFMRRDNEGGLMPEREAKLQAHELPIAKDYLKDGEWYNLRDANGDWSPQMWHAATNSFHTLSTAQLTPGQPTKPGTSWTGAVTNAWKAGEMNAGVADVHRSQQMQGVHPEGSPVETALNQQDPDVQQRMAYEGSKAQAAANYLMGSAAYRNSPLLRSVLHGTLNAVGQLKAGLQRFEWAPEEQERADAQQTMADTALLDAAGRVASLQSKPGAISREGEEQLKGATQAIEPLMAGPGAFLVNTFLTSHNNALAKAEAEGQTGAEGKALLHAGLETAMFAALPAGQKALAGTLSGAVEKGIAAAIKEFPKAYAGGFATQAIVSAATQAADRISGLDPNTFTKSTLAKAATDAAKDQALFAGAHSILGAANATPEAINKARETGTIKAWQDATGERIPSNAMRKKLAQPDFDTLPGIAPIPYEEGEPNATQTGQVPENRVEQHQGVTPGPDLRQDQAQVRGGEGEQTVRGDSAAPGGNVQEAQPPGEQVRSPAPAEDGQTQQVLGGTVQPAPTGDFTAGQRVQAFDSGVDKYGHVIRQEPDGKYLVYYPASNRYGTREGGTLKPTDQAAPPEDTAAVNRALSVQHLIQVTPGGVQFLPSEPVSTPVNLGSSEQVPTGATQTPPAAFIRRKGNDLEGQLHLGEQPLPSNQIDHRWYVANEMIGGVEYTGQNALAESIAKHGPVLAEATQDGHIFRIHAGGQETIQAPDGRILSAGKWQDSPESHYPENYDDLPIRQRAALEVEEQKKYGYKHDYEFYNRLYDETHTPKEATDERQTIQEASQPFNPMEHPEYADLVKQHLKAIHEQELPVQNENERQAIKAIEDVRDKADLKKLRRYANSGRDHSAIEGFDEVYDRLNPETRQYVDASQQPNENRTDTISRIALGEKPKMTQRGDPSLVGEAHRRAQEQLANGGTDVDFGDQAFFSGLPPGLIPVEKIAKLVNNLWQKRGVKAAMATMKDAGETAAGRYATQQTNDVRGILRREVGEKNMTTADDALTFYHEAGGNAATLQQMLGKVQSAPKEIYRAARYRATKAIKFALDNMDKMEPASREYAAKTDAQVDAENSKGIPTLKLQNYVKHAQEFEDEPGSAGSGSSAFLKNRKHATIADSMAAGINPESLSALDLLHSRLSAGQRMMANRSWIDSLRTLRDEQTGAPIAAQPQSVQRADGSNYMVPPRGYSLERAGNEPIAVQNGYEGIFHALTDPSIFSRSGVGKSLLKLGQTAKSGILLFDTYHLGRLAMHEAVIKSAGMTTAEAPLPTYRKGLAALDFTPEEINRMAQSGEIPKEWVPQIHEYQKVIGGLIDNGFNVGRIADALHQEWVRAIPVIGTFNKFIFDKFQRGAMTEIGYLEYQRLKKADPNMPDDQALRTVAQAINTRFGQLGRQGLFKSRTAQDLARLFVLAPQWNEGLIRSELGAYMGVGKSAMDAATGRRIYAGTLMRSVGGMALATFAGNQLLNMYFRGHPTWQNKEEGFGAKVSGYVPDVVGGGPGFFVHPLGVAAEMTHLFLNSIEKNPSQSLAGKVMDAGRQLATWRASALMRPFVTWMTGKDFMGRAISTEDLPGEVAKSALPLPISGTAGYLAAKELITGEGGQQFAGQFQKQLMSSFGVRTDPVPADETRISRLAQKFNSEKGITPSAQFYAGDYAPLITALRANNPDQAKQLATELKSKKSAEEIQKHFSTWSKHPFTGKAEREQEFVNTLSAEQRQAYDNARADRQRLAQQALEAAGLGPKQTPVRLRSKLKIP